MLEIQQKKPAKGWKNLLSAEKYVKIDSGGGQMDPQQLKILQSCPLFTDISRDELNAVLNCLQARMIHVSRGQLIFQEGQPAAEIGIVLSGWVQIIREDYFGNRSIIGRAEPSQLFGEAFACAGTEMLVDVVAATDSEIMLADCRKVLTLCKNSCSFHNKIIYNLLQIVARKNLLLSQKLEILSRRSTRDKLMQYLLQEARQTGNDSFSIPYDRQGLADFLGVERSALSAEISRMRSDGLIECKKSWFRLIPQSD